MARTCFPFVGLFLAIGLLCQAAKKPVTPDAISTSRRTGGLRSVVWAPDGEQFVYKKDGAFILYNAAAQNGRELIRTAVLENEAVEVPKAERFDWRNRRVRESAIQWFPDGQRLLVKLGGDLFILRIETAEWSQLTKTPVDEADPKLSPDAQRVSYRNGPDLYALEIASGKTRRLTRDGSATLRNAQLDWVYPEELSLSTAHWWSPDSRHIAYMQFDVSRQHFYPHADIVKLRAIDEPQRYPKAGTPNASIRLGIVSPKGGRTQWLDSVDGARDLMARVDWLPDSSGLAVQKLTRLQDRLELRLVPLNGAQFTLIEESDEHWINLTNHYRFLKESRRLVWSSERDGDRHLYLFSTDGGVGAQLTEGQWQVDSLTCVDEKSETAYFTSTESSPLERHLYQVKLDGSCKRRITTGPGTHSISMSPTCAYYIDAYSSMEHPTERTLHSADGRRLAVLQRADRSAQEEYELLPAEIVEFLADDGELLYGRVTRPSGFESGLRYPAIVMVYGGPHSQTVRNSWSGADLKQAFAHAGFVVWQMDNRGSSGRGHAWETKVSRQFGKVELRDQVVGVKHLLAMGFVDPKRIGVYGWSYGGYMTIYSLLHAPELFRAGVAGAPVTDWRNYDTIYTERYMGLPSQNEDGYQASSPVHFANKLKGDLLLIHNFEDDNVLFQNTMRMADELQRAGKPFEMMIYPQKSHGVSGKAKNHLNRGILEFFERKLK